MRTRTERPTTRRLVSIFAAIGLVTGLIAALGSAGVAQATGGPGTAFPMPAGSVAYFSGAQINGGAVNSLSWGYQVGVDSPVIKGNNGGGSTQVDTPNFQVGPFASDTSIRVFLTDNSCGSATYYSDLTPYDHVTITGTTAYHMDFLDANGGCSDQNTNRYDGPGIYNFKVDLSFDGLPLSVTKVADVSSVEPTGTVNYTITVTNPNVTGASIDTITDDLPAGFSMVPGTTSGVVSSDPAVSGQHLAWDTTETIVPGNSTADLTFQAQAGPDTGDFYNNAGATSPDLAVTPSGDTALVTVIPPSCPSGVSPPDAPTNVVAYPGNTSAALTWTAPADGGAPIDHYTVNIYDQSTEGSSSFQTSDASTSAQVSDLINGDSYRFGVQATNCAGTGQESALSDAVTPAAGSSAEVIGPGNLSQTTGTPGVPPSPDDTTVGAQIFPPGTTGIGTLQELGPGGPAAIRGAVPIGQFCGGSICLGNVLQAELIGGGLGPNPHGGVAFYRLRLLLDRSIVPDFTKAYQVWYDGNLTDDNDSPVDPTPPATLSRCPKVFTGTPCIAQIRRTETLDLRIVVKSSDLDPRLSTSK